MGRTTICIGVAVLVAVGSPAIAGAVDARDDSVSAAYGEERSFNVLENDIGTGLSLTGHTPSVEGYTVSCSSDGTCTYFAEDGPCPGSDSFGYTASDGSSSDTATVTVTLGCDGGGSAEPIDKDITFELSGHLKASGDVSASETKCVADEKVVVYVKDMGYWNKVESTTTNAAGHFSISIPDLFGVYRAKTPASAINSPTSCSGATSSKRSYKSNDPVVVTDGNDVSTPLDLAKVKLDHDGRFLYFWLTTQEQISYEDFNGGNRRFELYLPDPDGGWWQATVAADGSNPENPVIVDVVHCSDGFCDHANAKAGEGSKSGARQVKGRFRLSFLGDPDKVTWQARSYHGAPTIDYAPASPQTYNL